MILIHEGCFLLPNGLKLSINIKDLDISVVQIISQFSYLLLKNQVFLLVEVNPLVEGIITGLDAITCRGIIKAVENHANGIFLLDGD